MNEKFITALFFCALSAVLGASAQAFFHPQKSAFDCGYQVGRVSKEIDRRDIRPLLEVCREYSGILINPVSKP